MSDTNSSGNNLSAPLPQSDIEGFVDVLEQTDGLNVSTFLNRFLGMGDSAYDSSTEDEINFQPTIDDGTLINLYRNSAIAGNIVDVLPDEASWGHPVFSGSRYKQYGVDQNRLEEFIGTALELGGCPTLESLFRNVTKSARLLGVAYLVMGFDDGLHFSEPLNEDNIGSLQWVIQKNKLELTPDDYMNPVYYTLINRYQINSEPKILESKIHASRVLKFTGTHEVPEVLEMTRQHDSVLQKAFRAIARDEKGIELGNQLLVKKAVLWAKLKLAQAATTEQRRTILTDRLRQINRYSSIYRMVGLNSDEELGSNQIQLTDIDKVLQANLERLVSVSGINRFKLLGTPSSEGLGQASRGLEQRLDFAQKSKAFAIAFWHDNLLRFYRLACKTSGSPTGGKLPLGLGVNFPTNLQIFPDEWAELRKNNATWAKDLQTLGVLGKNEIRQAFFAATDLESQLVPNLVLSEALTKQLEASDVNPQEKPRELPGDQKEIQTDADSEGVGAKVTKPDAIKIKNPPAMDKLKKALEILGETEIDDLNQIMGELADG